MCVFHEVKNEKKIKETLDLGNVEERFSVHSGWDCKFKQVLKCLVIIHVKIYDILPFDLAIPLLELYPTAIYTYMFFPTLFSVEKKLESLQMISNMELVKWVMIWVYSKVLCTH